MRPGVSRVVVEIIILVIAVALALLIFSPVSSYIFGALGRTSQVGGASTIQILSVEYSGGDLKVYVKNLGPNTIMYSGTSDFQVFIDGSKATVSSPSSAGTWSVDSVVTIEVSVTSFDTTKQHNIVVYGPGNTMAQYLYSP